jgi:hypothetical protein
MTLFRGKKSQCLLEVRKVNVPEVRKVIAYGGVTNFKSAPKVRHLKPFGPNVQYNKVFISFVR